MMIVDLFLTTTRIYHQYEIFEFSILKAQSNCTILDLISFKSLSIKRIIVFLCNVLKFSYLACQRVENLEALWQNVWFFGCDKQDLWILHTIIVSKIQNEIYYLENKIHKLNLIII